MKGYLEKIKDDMRDWGDWLSHIRWAWQRARRGYDDRIFWELDSYLNQFIPAIREFCEGELENENMGLNPERKAVFEETIRLADALDNMDMAAFYKSPNAEIDFWSFVGKNIAFYWN